MTLPRRLEAFLPTLLVAAFSASAAQGREFVPALNEPCGIKCPDPDAPMSRTNFPPGDDNFSRMFVPTETGLELVRNPDWNGKESSMDEWCGITCPNPYAPLSSENLPRRNDASQWMFVPTEFGFKMVPNPNWVIAARIEAVIASAPLPSLGASGGEPGGNIVLESLDRSGVVYHATGDDVFRPDVLKSIGGVLSQSSTVKGRHGRPPTVELVFGQDGNYPGHVLVRDGAGTGRYRIPYDQLVPMALFVDSGGTSLYTLWGEDKLPANFPVDAGFVKYENGPGFVALEFAGTRYADALYFLDTCSSCAAVPDEGSEARANVRIAFDTESGNRRSSSYINTDVGMPFDLEVTETGLAAVAGGIVRFHWSGVAGTGRDVSIGRGLPVVRPEELPANVVRLLEEMFRDRELEDLHLSLLMRGIDVSRFLREEGRLRGRRKLQDTFFLFETLALLRSTKLHLPADWSAFMAGLSLDWLVRRNRKPWERYSEKFCTVYPTAVECNDRNKADAE